MNFQKLSRNYFCRDKVFFFSFLFFFFVLFFANERNPWLWLDLDHLRSFRLVLTHEKRIVYHNAQIWVECMMSVFPSHAEPAGPHGHRDGGRQSYPAWEHSSGEPCGGADIPATVEKSQRLRAAERPGAAGLPTTGGPTLLLRHLPINQTWSLLESSYNNKSCIDTFVKVNKLDKSGERW